MSKLIEYNSNLRDRARELRLGATKAERILWEEVLSKKKTGYKFTRQKPVGSFIADFYYSKLKLVIELDGGIHNRADQSVYDDDRQDTLKQEGYRFIRVTNNEVEFDIESLLEKINSMT